MPVLINFKICDNSKDCSGIQVCPMKAFFWDEEKKTIAVHEDKCVTCGLCEKSCPVGAIRVARTKEEYERIKKEIENDPRRVSDLFVDRYGAEPRSPAFFISKNDFPIQILEATQIAVVEFFTNESIECLLHSIPIKELFPDIKIKYRKIELGKDDVLIKTYQIDKFPSLLFFKDGHLVAKIEGYFNNDQKKILMKKIKDIMFKIS